MRRHSDEACGGATGQWSGGQTGGYRVPSNRFSPTTGRHKVWSRMNVMLRGLTLAIVMAGLAPALASGQEAQWIWSPTHDKDDVPHTACHFRKSLFLRSIERGQVTIIADDEYELYINGRRVGSGNSLDKLFEYDVTRFLARGRNVIGVKVTNVRGSTAALAARVSVKEQDDRWRNYSTDATWRTNLSPLPFWNTTLYNDQRWPAAQEFGELGRTAPWDVREDVPHEAVTQTERFKVDDEFEVTELVGHDAAGSLIAMTFNEFGHMLVSRDGGPLMLVYDSDDDGQMDKVREYCSLVNGCQGLLSLNGDVYTTADGPDGIALYRLSDKDQDGQLEDVKPLLKFGGQPGEHGPHGLVLGPDGMLYVVLGNDAQPKFEVDANSPHRNFYEGDLLPRYEDPGGHAAGAKVPGGTVIRTDIDGENVELVAGGLRNAYDLAFNREGELLVHDSDMESDMGTSWYRPTRLYHVTGGGEYGWRSGWSKWPDDLVDVLPAVVDTGRGSPTGAAFYNHYAFPTRYHDALFLGNWSEGRILAVTLDRDGASYSGRSHVFLQGQPLNVTDLEIGPDGALYFVTGGRGTNGGIYRVHWKGKIPEVARDLGEGIAAAIRQPQLHSAWGRQQIAAVKQQMPDSWSQQLAGVARSKANPWYYRVRALHLMQLFGTTPDTRLLITLSESQNEVVRGKAAQLMGEYADARTHDRLIELLEDPDRMVRRKACEALVRAGQTAPLDALTPLLGSDDRFEAWAARRLLERLPVERWRDRVLATDHHRLFIQGSLALMIEQPTRENGLAVIERFASLTDGFITDRDFIDMLRLAQVALHRGGLLPSDVSDLHAKLAREFPAGDDIMNRELMRLLAFLEVDEPLERYLAYLDSSIDNVQRLHVALHLRFITKGWPDGKKLDLLDFYRRAREWEGGGSYKRYIENVERDFAKSLTPGEALLVLDKGEQWPNAALGALYALPPELSDELVASLTTLDQKLADSDDDSAQLFRTGLLAVLASSDDESALQHLRKVWEEEPERRLTAVMALAQHPDANWEYLVRSVPILEGDAAREVLGKLLEVDAAPGEDEYYRQTIICGLRLEDEGRQQAIHLLQHWTGLTPGASGNSDDDRLRAWQAWYADTYPDGPPAELPVAPRGSKWQFDELIHHLVSEQGSKGSTEHGAEVYEKAQCVKCHRFGDRGESMGPDLTSISKRFMKKEVLESILYPSHVVSDQYAAKTVVTVQGRSYTGIVAPGAQGETVVLKNDGTKSVIDNDEIDEIVPSQSSAMPAGLLDNLTLEEISDLFAYLGVLPTQVATRTLGDGESVERR